jgi:hypothetical protein
MTDRITLTIPADEPSRGVATLVIGGVGSRLDLPYERVDDLQLAVLSVLGASDGSQVTVEVVADDDAVLVSVGPLAAGSATNGSLTRVLGPLVDSVTPSPRGAEEWLTLRLDRP